MRFRAAGVTGQTLDVSVREAGRFRRKEVGYRDDPASNKWKEICLMGTKRLAAACKGFNSPILAV